MKRAATVPVEIAHLGTDGVLHGHSLTIEAWTAADVCLDEWHKSLAKVAATIEGRLETTIGGRTFEDVATNVMKALPGCCEVVIRLPTKGHIVRLVA